MCFACLTEKASESGALSTFSLRQKPIQAPCAICDNEIKSGQMSPSPWGFICDDCRDLCESQTGVSWNEVKITAQKAWMVKANSRILGPYSTEEVESELKLNHIVALDEIAKPAGRWKLIRNE